MSSMNLLTTLLQQNEIQRAILNEIIALNGSHLTSAAVAGRIQSQPISNVNGNTGNRSSSKEISSYLVYISMLNLQVYLV